MTVISKSNGVHLYVKYFKFPTRASVVKNFECEIEGTKFTGNLDVRSDTGGLIGALSTGWNKHTNKNQTYEIFRPETNHRPDVGIDVIEFFQNHSAEQSNIHSCVSESNSFRNTRGKIEKYKMDEYRTYCDEYLNSEYEPIDELEGGGVVIRYKREKTRRWCPTFTTGYHKKRATGYGNRCVMWTKNKKLFYKCLSARCQKHHFLGLVKY